MGQAFTCTLGLLFDFLKKQSHAHIEIIDMHPLLNLNKCRTLFSIAVVNNIGQILIRLVIKNSNLHLQWFWRSLKLLSY